MSGVTETYGLTKQQKAAMLGEGNLFLTACPGSGKTTSIAGRVAMLTAQGKRVALLSHTKVGAKELGESVSRDHGISLTDESFVGTIHSFLGRYILQPFGHLLTESVVPVTMDPDEANRIYSESSSAWFRLLSRDSVECIKKQFNTAANAKAALADLLRAAKAGAVSYDDGLFWSLEVLRAYPHVTNALASRFDEIIVDEAQDSNEKQIAVLEVLKKAGLASLVMVGDFDQSIYAFGGANPARCRQAAKTMKLTPATLTENHRASQLLCNVSAKFRSSPVPDTAVGIYETLQIPPILIKYDSKNMGDLTSRFSSLQDEYEVEGERSAILVRNNVDVNAMTGGSVKLEGIIGALYECANGESALSSIRELERLLIRSAGLSRSSLDRLKVRSIAYEVVMALPSLTGDAHEWASAAASAYDNGVRNLSPAAAGATPTRVPPNLRHVEVESLGELSVGDHRVTTIHGTKGESVDAVMIVAGEPAADWHTEQAKVWASPLMGSGPSAISEELRLFYVALTRARQLAVLAVPESTSVPTVQAYVRAGFVLR